MRRVAKALILLCSLFVLLYLGFSASTDAIRRVGSGVARYAWTSEELAARVDSLRRDMQELREKNRELSHAARTRAPEGVYVVIDRHANRLYLKRGDAVLREAVCSTGSGEELAGPGGRQWLFRTPRGVFEVLGKYDTPTWIRPDWAFVEEEKPIPPRGAPERLQDFMLGEYALTFGNGYMIHGTLYTRLLGESVTHGCVRLGDEDLEAVYQATKVGTRIYIY